MKRWENLENLSPSDSRLFRRFWFGVGSLTTAVLIMWFVSSLWR